MNFWKPAHAPPPPALVDFYTPSNAAIANCMAGASDTPDYLRRTTCAVEVVRACEQGYADQFDHSGIDVVRCFSATRHYDEAQRMHVDAVSDAREAREASFYLLGAAFVLAVVAWAIAISRRQDARSRASGVRTNQQPLPPRSVRISPISNSIPPVQVLAKVTGFAWGRIEKRAATLRHAFEEGRAATNSTPKKPIGGNQPATSDETT